MVENPGGITQAMRDRAEENMKQAHAAYEELADYVNKAMNAWTGGMTLKFHGHALQRCPGPRHGFRKD